VAFLAFVVGGTGVVLILIARVVRRLSVQSADAELLAMLTAARLDCPPRQPRGPADPDA
jgi:hypothetical protein